MYIKNTQSYNARLTRLIMAQNVHRLSSARYYAFGMAQARLIHFRNYHQDTKAYADYVEGYPDR